MPQTNLNVGRALAELSAGKADRLSIEPVALDAGDPALASPTNDPRMIDHRTVVTPAGDIISQAQATVGPTALPAPNTALNGIASNGAMTIEQAQAIVASLNPAALTIGPQDVQLGPNAAPAINGAVATTPVTTPPSQQAGLPPQAAAPGPVDLDLLAQPSAVSATVQPATLPATEPTPVAAPAATAPPPTEQQRVIIPEDALVDTPLGPIPWREAKGNMLRRQEFERQRREVLETKRTVESQQHLISKAAQSRFGAAYIASLNAGASDEEAINAGLSASGVERAPHAVPTPEQPLVPPDENDPQFQQKYAEYLGQVSARAAREAVRREIDPVRQQLSAQQQAQVQTQTQTLAREREAEATLRHNRELFATYIEPLMPPGLDQTQRTLVMRYLDETAQAEGIPIDVNRPVADSDFRLLAAYAFPSGQLPPNVVARLSSPVANGSPSYAPNVNGYVPSNGAAPANNAPAYSPQMPPALAQLPEWQKNALLTQALQTIQNYRTVVGQTPQGVLPGLPSSPALQAGPNPSAAAIGGPNTLPMMRPEERIRATMQSIPRA